MVRNVAAAVINMTADSFDDDLENRWNCLCDDQCVTYGDCCTDWTSFDPVEQQKAAARYSCIRTGMRSGVYAVAKCPDTWTKDPAVKDACETPGGFDRYGTVLGSPVTSRSTGSTYLNRFCAVCNGDAADSAVAWSARLVCNDLTDVANGSDQAVRDSLRRGDGGQWTVEYGGQPYECSLVAAPRTAVVARSCQPGVVSACHPRWPDAEMRSNCEAYTTVMYYGDRPYKNAHCAICNNVPVQKLSCGDEFVVHSRGPNGFKPRSFSTLFVAQPGHRECDGDKFYDQYRKTCRPLASVTDGVPLNCSKVAMYPAAPPDWLPSGAVEYVRLDNGTLAVCVDRDKIAAESALNSEAYKSATVTYVGLGVSVVFLIVHLAVFAVLPEMKNLSGKNLASFCVSLVCSYAAFITGNWLTGPACYAGAALTYYTFLTSFAWMLVMSFDCWRTLRLATVKLRVTTGRQTKKFLVYSAVCWLVPAMLTFVAVAADAVPAVPDDFRPRFGADQCWFGSKTALLVFFVGPLGAVMAVNLVLFAWTAYMIHSSRATVRHVNTRHVRRDFRMYCRLAVLMGLTWSTGILASLTDKKYLWIVFVVLNTFQGLFVFVAFTCRRRILDALVGDSGRADNGRVYSSSGPEKDNANRPTPPTSSFSWSSAHHSAPVGSEKTSDALY